MWRSDRSSLGATTESKTSGVYAGSVLANAWSELLGLGGSMLLGPLVFSKIDETNIGVIISCRLRS